MNGHTQYDHSNTNWKEELRRFMVEAHEQERKLRHKHSRENTKREGNVTRASFARELHNNPRYLNFSHKHEEE